MVRDITYAESKEINNLAYVDVRSPGEFNEDHIPGAVNIALFDDRERSEVGTIYRTSGRRDAILRGTDIVGSKLASLMDRFTAFSEGPLVIYCARGGMRSGSVSSLLDSIGYRVYRLAEGYRNYRRYVMDGLSSLKGVPPLVVLQGLTGTGKTEILRNMKWGIDLEAMAGHRSSVFGALGLVQNSQKRLETLLLSRLVELREAPFAVVEAESRKIGNLQVPDAFFRKMKESPAILIQASMMRRIDIIEREYPHDVDTSQIEGIIESIRDKLGQAVLVDLRRELLNKNLRGFIGLLLEKYYDPLYSYSIGRRKYFAEIENKDTMSSVEQINKYIYKFIYEHINP